MKKTVIVVFVVFSLLFTACVQEQKVTAETSLPKVLELSGLSGQYEVEDYTDYGLWLLTIEANALTNKVADADTYYLETEGNVYAIQRNPLNAGQLMIFLPEHFVIENLSSAKITMEQIGQSGSRGDNDDIFIETVYITKDGKEYELTLENYLFMKQASKDTFVYADGKLLRPDYVKSSDGYTYSMQSYYNARQVSEDHDVNGAFSFLKKLENYESYVYVNNPYRAKIEEGTVAVYDPDTRDRVWELGAMGAIDEAATYTYDIADNSNAQTLTLTIKEENLPTKYNQSGEYEIQFKDDATVCSFVNRSGNLYDCVIEYAITDNVDLIKNARFSEASNATQTDIRLKGVNKAYALLITDPATVLKVASGTTVAQMKSYLEAVDGSNQTYTFKTTDGKLSNASILTKNGTLTVTSEYGEPYIAQFEMRVNPTPFVRLETTSKIIWHNTIGDAVTGASESDYSTITVWPGLYRENITFGSKAIHLMSTDPASETVRNTTIIDGMSNGNTILIGNLAGGSMERDGSEEQTIVEGFTLTGGASVLSPTSQRADDSVLGMISAAVAVNREKAIIRNNLITGNGTDTGDGMSNLSGCGIISEYATSTVYSNEIRNNYNVLIASGAAVANGTAEIYDNLITQNTGNMGGGILVTNLEETGVSSRETTDETVAKIYRNTISENTAGVSEYIPGDGAGIYIYKGCSILNANGEKWRHFNSPAASIEFVEGSPAEQRNVYQSNAINTGSDQGTDIMYDESEETPPGTLEISPVTVPEGDLFTLTATYTFAGPTWEGGVELDSAGDVTLAFFDLDTASVTIGDGEKRLLTADEKFSAYTIQIEGITSEAATKVVFQICRKSDTAMPAKAYTLRAIPDADGGSGSAYGNTQTGIASSELTIKVSGPVSFAQGETTAEYDTIQAAVAAISGTSPATLTLNNDLYREGSQIELSFCPALVTIQAAEGKSPVIDGEEQYRPFSLTNSPTVTFKGITFTKGYYELTDGEDGGGAIKAFNTPLVLNDCVFTSNKVRAAGGEDDYEVYGHGGAIYSTYATLILNDCTFTSNVLHNASYWTPVYGAAISVQTMDFLNISSCEFDSNHMIIDDLNNTSGCGGAVNADYTDLTVIESSTFTGNSASGDFAGAVRIYGETSGGDSVKIRNSSFTSNSSIGPWSGGGALALMNMSGASEISDCVFDSNETNKNGGAIYIHTKNDFEITDTVIKNNSANQNGGGIYLYYTNGSDITTGGVKWGLGATSLNNAFSVSSNGTYHATANSDDSVYITGNTAESGNSYTGVTN